MTQTMLQAITETDQPSAVFAALEARVQATIGVKLFTLMTLDRTGGLARRIYSNMPDAYPPLGAKEMQENAWTAQVIDRHETFVANDIDAIAAVFPDHPLIQSLGCESCINIPVIVAGAVLGTLNCLHEAGHYTPDRVAASETLKEPGALAFLIARVVEDPT